ncbi:MAG: hypothetical protein HYU54_11450 [Actinobacteria bacterium]|nr:hypothetical protein [Actinomycetota bacterium]
MGRITLNRWADRLGALAMSPLEVSAELRPPSWSGFLGVDGKAIFVAGQEATLLVGVDQATHDVVHAVVAEIEGEEAFERLVREAVTEAGYPLKGLVMDAAAPFVAAHANYFARVPLQLCRIHASRRLDFVITKAKRSPDAPLRAELKDRVRKVLFAVTEEEARRLFRALLADGGRYEGLGRRDTLGAMERTFDLYMTHHRVEGMPADANITENVSKQLGKKPRLMEGFATLESAERFSRLLIGCYRFKQFTDSSRKAHNGRAPLELAGGDLSILWARSQILGPNMRVRPNAGVGSMWRSGLTMGVPRGLWVCPHPPPRPNLTSNRVLPNSPHPGSSFGRRVGRPGSVSGSTQGAGGLPHPRPS